MPFQYKLHLLAQKEYKASISWYLDRSVDAAENFIKAVDTGLANICKNPDRYRNRYRNYREYNLRRYPFTIVYIVLEQSRSLSVVAIHHHKKHGGKYRRP